MNVKDLLFPELNDIFENTKTPQHGRLALSKEMAEFMLAGHLSNFVIFNLVTESVHLRSYNGHVVAGVSHIKKLAPKFKDFCAQSSVMAGRTPIAVIAKTYLHSRDEYGTLNYPYSPVGRRIAGNVMFYDPVSKPNYSLLPGGWIPCGERACTISASEEALLEVFNRITSDTRSLESFAYKRR